MEPVVTMTPKDYLTYWTTVMGIATAVVVLVGGILIWRVNVLITLLTELLKK